MLLRNPLCLAEPSVGHTVACPEVLLCKGPQDTHQGAHGRQAAEQDRGGQGDRERRGEAVCLTVFREGLRGDLGEAGDSP